MQRRFPPSSVIYQGQMSPSLIVPWRRRGGRVAPVLVLLLGCAGCGILDRAQLVEEVLASDPAFQEILERRDEYASHIETAAREFSLKRATVDRAIQKLREDLVESQKKAKSKRRHFKQLMEPVNRQLGFAVSMAKEELRAKRVQRSSVGRSITRVRKTLESVDETWSEQERSRQEAQLTQMQHDAERLEGEMTTLKEHLHLLKIKQQLIRL